MRVLHVHAPGPEPPILARFQEKFPGVETKLIKKGYTKGTYHGWKTFLALRHFTGVDVVHYHGNLWIWRPRLVRYFDGSFAKLAGARVCFTFQGSDVRVARMDLQLEKFFTETNVSVYNPDLTEFIRDSAWMPYAIDTERWLATPRNIAHIDELTHLDELVVGFYNAPRPDIYIHQELLPKAARILKKKGVNVVLKPCFGIPPYEMERYYDTIDVYVDTRSFGWYGDGPCEAALRNVVPVTWIEEKYMYLVDSKQFFIRTDPTPEGLAGTLLDLKEENVRKTAIEDARHYVLKKHAAMKVAAEFLN